MAHNFYKGIMHHLFSRGTRSISQTYSTPFGSFKITPVFIHLAALGFVNLGLFNVLKSLDFNGSTFLFSPVWLAVLGSVLIAIGILAHLGTLKKLARRTGASFGMMALVTWVLSAFLVSVTSALNSPDSLFHLLGTGFEGLALIFLGLQFYMALKALSNSSLRRKFYVRKM